MEYKINGLTFETPEYWIYGTGKWRDKNGTIYEIESIKYPPTPNGKHVYINSDIDGSASYRSLEQGEILEFHSTKITKVEGLF